MAIQQETDGELRELALFAGAGGGILGGKLLGWRTVCAVEWDAYAASVLAARQNDGCLIFTKVKNIMMFTTTNADVFPMRQNVFGHVFVLRNFLKARVQQARIFHGLGLPPFLRGIAGNMR